MEQVIVRHKGSGNAYVSHLKGSKSAALKKKKGSRKQGEREAASKKAGFYVQGHKNYGDVYEP